METQLVWRLMAMSCVFSLVWSVTLQGYLMLHCMWNFPWTTLTPATSQWLVSCELPYVSCELHYASHEFPYASCELFLCIIWASLWIMWASLCITWISYASCELSLRYHMSFPMDHVSYLYNIMWVSLSIMWASLCIMWAIHYVSYSYWYHVSYLIIMVYCNMWIAHNYGIMCPKYCLRVLITRFVDNDFRGWDGIIWKHHNTNVARCPAETGLPGTGVIIT